ncbi:uncharacterized protein LOC117221286 [Megalopta genalis]|uniref:uncharacterized protein LOC117221286 n=1 Tax=Megalopta genalis TaxID=115081 RepID=UPI0014438681|nr:uncharacterized protein LOC117221286 [Megalopta genalis]
MEPEETTRLFCGKHVHEAIRINACKQKQWGTESMRNDFPIYTVDPAWMNVRLFVFWFLWAMLIIVLVASVLSYCYLTPQKGTTTTDEIFILNTTNT